MEERLIGVETKLAFLERSFEQLDGVVRELSERIDRLQHHIERHQEGDRSDTASRTP